MKSHLECGGQLWCDDAQDHETITEDPRDATCIECLRRAAAYGAAAAMRYAAVEAGATQDPELARERDEAIRRLNATNKLLDQRGAFVCYDCGGMFRADQRTVQAGFTSWCATCVPPGGGR